MMHDESAEAPVPPGNPSARRQVTRADRADRSSDDDESADDEDVSLAAAEGNVKPHQLHVTFGGRGTAKTPRVAKWRLKMEKHLEEARANPEQARKDREALHKAMQEAVLPSKRSRVRGKETEPADRPILPTPTLDAEAKTPATHPTTTTTTVSSLDASRS
jgi:hypothetical protein